MAAEPLDFSSARVLVAGDLMLDRYWHGATSRISPEAPVPVVAVEHEEVRPGGAGNVAANVAALGAATRLVAAVGEDADGRRLAELLAAAGVACALHAEAAMRTIVKLRVMSQHQQLIRLDFEQQPPAPPATAGAIAQQVRARLGECDVLVLSDYAKGSLGDCAALLAAAREQGVRSVADPKGADFERYRGAGVLTPNLRELEAVVGPCAGEAVLAERAGRLVAELGLEALLVTRGEDGMTLVQRAGDVLHMPARAREVYDVTGAGDTVCAVLAAGLAAGYDLPRASALANVAAGIAVSRLGAVSVPATEIEAQAGAAHDGEGALLGGAADAARECRAAQRRGERVVLTNGCFDVLHAGHVRYLTEARALGDRLLVAVNDDASVRRLKGAARPLVPLAERMAVLAALAPVDWVVAFAEDTPRELIERIRPDVLVKGGDYRTEDIAGADFVRSHGGEVRTLALLEGVSSSAIIRRAARCASQAGPAR